MSRLRNSPARRRQATVGIRGVLIAGFIIVFGLWALSSYELARRLHEVEQRNAAEQQAAGRADLVLSTVRTNVLLGSIYLRDALIDTRAATIDYYRGQLNDIRSEVDRLVPAYLGEVTSDEERRLWSELNAELRKYWTSRDLVFDQAAATSTTQAAAVLRRQLVPSRETILQITDRITDLQGLAQRRHEAEISGIYAELRGRFLLISFVAIVVGLGVAGFATRHVFVLEREIAHQHLEDRRTKQELERLSARLVNVQEQERRTLAQELHDEVGQALTAIMIDIAVALRTTDMGARERSSLEEARTIAGSTLQGVRDLSQLLHPSMLDDFGLPEAVAAYLRSYSARTGLQVDLVREGMQQRLPPQVETCVYRIVQEALTNVAKHGGARMVEVLLRRDRESLELVIKDDGSGFDLGAIRSRAGDGLGLIGMRERAQALGGSFAIQSQQGEGTRVMVRIPVTPPASEAQTIDPDALAG